MRVFSCLSDIGLALCCRRWLLFLSSFQQSWVSVTAISVCLRRMKACDRCCFWMLWWSLLILKGLGLGESGCCGLEGGRLMACCRPRSGAAHWGSLHISVRFCFSIARDRRLVGLVWGCVTLAVCVGACVGSNCVSHAW